MTDTRFALFPADVLDARISDPAFQGAIAAALRRADEERWVERLHDRDASLWSADPAVQATIANRLGWLECPGDFADQAPALEGFGEAIREAAMTRLRPVLMTSGATIAGHFPLTLVTGAGALARNSIGLVLVGGMTIGTLFTLFVIPSIYMLIAKDHAKELKKD